MQASTKKAVLKHLEDRSFQSVLDAPSGNGWLQKSLDYGIDVDGIDLYEEAASGYRNFWKRDLDEGLPEECGNYDLICCCEGIEHVGNPLLLLRHFQRALVSEGQLLISTPNIWYPQARLQFFLRGFFPSFPSLVDKVRPGTHMHVMPWSYPQLYVFFRLAGFSQPIIIPEARSRAKHIHERLLGLPAKWYCQSHLRRSKTEEARAYWEAAGSQASRLGRHLIVYAAKEEGFV